MLKTGGTSKEDWWDVKDVKISGLYHNNIQAQNNENYKATD